MNQKKEIKMNKITFKNPRGGTVYLAKVGFDWGAFWAMLALGGLPFFLRKMNVLGAFCLVFSLIEIIGLGFGQVSASVWDRYSDSIVWGLTTIAFSLYFGFRGGKLTARHYVEEGYKCITKDEGLLMRAQDKWGLDL
jgi:hypothetical protein